MGRFVRGDHQYQVAGRKDQFLPVRMRAWLLHLPDRLGSGLDGTAESHKCELLPDKIADRDRMPDLVGDE